MARLFSKKSSVLKSKNNNNNNNNTITSSVISYEIPVPANVAIEVYTDFDNAIHFLPHILSIELIRGKSFLNVGSRWREVRLYNNRKRTMYKTLTKLETNNNTDNNTDNNTTDFIMAISIDLNEVSCLLKHATETATLCIRPITTNSCEVMLTFAFISGGGFLFSKLIACIFRRFGGINTLYKHLETEIEYYKKEIMLRALKQHAEIKDKEQQNGGETP